MTENILLRNKMKCLKIADNWHERICVILFIVSHTKTILWSFQHKVEYSCLSSQLLEGDSCRLFSTYNYVAFVSTREDEFLIISDERHFCIKLCATKYSRKWALGNSKLTNKTKPVRKVSSPFEYHENWLHGP